MEWCPRRLSEDKINSFLKHFDAEKQEQALRCLHGPIITSRAMKLVSSLKRGDDWKNWSSEDKRKFKTIALLDDKHFNVIRKHMPHKSMGDLVQYYYGSGSSQKHVSLESARNKDYHDEVCYECEVGGDLICCDTCHLTFHLECAQPNTINLEDEHLGAQVPRRLRTQQLRLHTAKWSTSVINWTWPSRGRQRSCWKWQMIQEGK